MNECPQKSGMNGNTQVKSSLPGSVIGCVGSAVLGPCVLDGEVVDGEPQIISMWIQNSRFITCIVKTLKFEPISIYVRQLTNNQLELWEITKILHDSSNHNQNPNTIFSLS